MKERKKKTRATNKLYAFQKSCNCPTLSFRIEVIEEDTAEQLNRHLLIYQDTSRILVKISSIPRNDDLNLFSPFREKKPWFQILTQR